MAKRILITGLGSKLAWKIRAVELGKAINARVVPHATLGDMQRADVVVVCKWYTPEILRDLRKWGGPWVWDIVDAYPQPAAYKWSQEEAVRWLRNEVATLNPRAVAYATRAMAIDAEANAPSFTLHHHARPGQKLNPLRKEVKRVGYEGLTKYLGRWKGFLEQECKARGWAFVANPDGLHELDIVAALRDPRSYVTDHWKSNVKLANAQATGTPIVCLPEAGYKETDSTGGVWYVEDHEDLSKVLDYLTPHSERIDCASKLLAGTRHLADMAAYYRRMLESL